MAKELEGKVAAITGGASGIGLASAEAMLAAGARVVLVDRDEAALTALREKHGDAVIPLVIDLLDAKSCATLMSQILEKAGQLDILHANAGIYIGGDLVDANTDAIDRMLNLNVNVVMENVHDVLPHMIERGTGDIVVTLRVVQMGYKLLRPDCTPPGLQARHPRWLDLARSRHQRASRRLAGGEIEGGKGIRQLARSKRGGQCGDVHADTATRDDHSRRGHAAQQF
jgi:NAD(P)-dependent dehydrogenase (short-subunit alcohol dehydrogenase family)